MCNILEDRRSLIPLHLDITQRFRISSIRLFSPLNAELNPIRHLLALVGAHHILHVSRVRVKLEASMFWSEELRFTENIIFICSFPYGSENLAITAVQ